MTEPSTGPLNFGNTDRMMDQLRTVNENLGPNPFVGKMLPIPEEGEQFKARDMLPELKNPFTQGKEDFDTAQEGIKDIAEGKNPFTSGREPDGPPVVGDGSSAEQFLDDKAANQAEAQGSVFDRIKARGSEYLDNSKDRLDKLTNGENPFAQKDVPDNPFEKPESVKQRELDETIKDHKNINPFASRGGDVPENPFDKPGAESELPSDVTYYGKPMPDGAESELPSDVTYYGKPMPSTSAANLEAGNPFKEAVEQQSESALPTDGPAPEQKPVFERMEIGDTAKESEQELE